MRHPRKHIPREDWASIFNISELTNNYYLRQEMPRECWSFNTVTLATDFLKKLQCRQGDDRRIQHPRDLRFPKIYEMSMWYSK